MDNKDLLKKGSRWGCLELLEDGFEHPYLDQVKYKCKCRKCGKVVYYTPETIFSKPSYCYSPKLISQKFTYSISALNSRNARYNKYSKIESFDIVGDSEGMVPAPKYCEKWNEKRAKELQKKAEEKKRIIDSLSRYYAKNYEEDYVGLTYESYDILECTNEALESEPEKVYSYSERKMVYAPITVYKEYKCCCYLCKEERLVTCDKFGIYQPDFGDRSYRSDLHCKCHEPSSFEWIVNKLLFENRIHYRVEFHFDDLFGLYGQKFLTFDFAVFNDDGSIKCLIECQGEPHFKPVEEFGGVKALEDQKKNDEKKRIYAREHNIPLLEIKYTKKTEEQIKKILEDNGVI